MSATAGQYQEQGLLLPNMASFPPSASDLDAQLATITSLVSSYKADEGGAREALVKAARNLLNTVESPSEQIWRTLWAEPTHVS